MIPVGTGTLRKTEEDLGSASSHIPHPIYAE